MNCVMLFLVLLALACGMGGRAIFGVGGSGRRKGPFDDGED